MYSHHPNPSHYIFTTLATTISKAGPAGPKLKNRMFISKFCRVNSLTRSFSSNKMAPFNINNALDKEHEAKSLKAILSLPPSALQGLAPAADVFFAKLKIRNIEQLAHWKAFKIAQAVDYLAAYEVEGRNYCNSTANFHGAFDKEFCNHSLQQLLALPPHSVKGVAPWVNEELAHWRVNTIKDLAHWKFPRIAMELATLAQYETEQDE
jgi:hypothetical protein